MTNINISTILRDIGLHFVLIDIKNTLHNKNSCISSCKTTFFIVFLQCVLKQVAKLVTKHITKTI